MYVESLFPFYGESDFILNHNEEISISEIFSPKRYDTFEVSETNLDRTFNAFRFMPSNVIVLNERDEVTDRVKSGRFGSVVKVNITELEYSDVANRIKIEEIDGETVALLLSNDAFKREDIDTDYFIIASSNGIKVTDYNEILDEIASRAIEDDEVKVINIDQWLNDNMDRVNEMVSEATKEDLDGLIGLEQSGKSTKGKSVAVGKDAAYKWLDSYFAIPEGDDKNRSEVPLLIGPTAVFKSATIKELCQKYDYRLVDFRVSFTSRLDYSGLYQIEEIDGQNYSFSCPMEELVTCSDGFREYCKRAYSKISEILSRGYLEENKVSDGNTTDSERKPLTQEQENKLKTLLGQYKEYMKVPVLFFDEITRNKNKGVEGVLVQLLNQKRFENMTLSGCKFVAATNLNTQRDYEHTSRKDDLDLMYDVNTEIDVAYSNRFLPIVINPEDVQDRWFEWAESDKVDSMGNLVKNIHPIIIEFLKNNKKYIYNDKPVLDAIDANLSDNEKKAQTFPNYRTWDILSGYMFEIDKDYEFRLKTDKNAKKEYRERIINGLISEWAGNKFCEFLMDNGYVDFEDEHGVVDDQFGDFLDSTLSAGVPALMIGPSSMGKTSRVKNYMKKVEQRTGLKPLYIDVNLASKDTSDLMGYPVKKTLVDYVGGNGLKELGLESVSTELGNLVKDVTNEGKYGISDRLTVRAPEKRIADTFRQALKEGREVVLFFDECNRVNNPVIMSAMFEAISDYRIFGVSFKHAKDKVKIVAACNMSFDESQRKNKGQNSDDEIKDYNSAGSIDPALAARFSMFWKKEYDEYDVKSWLDYMKSQRDEGKIDGTIIDFIESLSEEEAVNVLASVEKRTIETGQPSSRAMSQLSKDIQSMRGRIGANGTRTGLYIGKVVMSDDIIRDYTDVQMSAMDASYSVEQKATKVKTILDKILVDRDNWEPAIVGGEEYEVIINSKTYSALDLMDMLQDISTRIGDMLVRGLTTDERDTLNTLCSVAMNLVESVRTLDDKVANSRKDVFRMYLGESISDSFAKYFNSVFGNESDLDITIEMLSDDSLIDKFFKIQRGKMAKYHGDTEKMVNGFIELMRDFLKAHGTTLPSKNYAHFITDIADSLVNLDNMRLLLKRCDITVQDMFKMAEGEGDGWIMKTLACFPGAITQETLDDMRARMAKSSNAVAKKRSRTRIL